MTRPPVFARSMRGILHAAFLLAAASESRASQTTTPQALSVRPDAEATVRALVQEALARGQAFAKLQELCKDTPHRAPGSPDLANAEAWAVRRMQADGLANVRLEEC